MKGKAKGIGYGTAFAVIVLTLVIIMGTYYILRTYTSGMVALQNYAEALQKPQLEIKGYTVQDNRITVYLINKGPGAVLIDNVKIFKEDVNGVPTGTVSASNLQGTVFIPVGGSKAFVFEVPDITDYVFWNKPVRILVETNKGLFTLSYPTLTGVIYVNIHLPTWLSTAGNLRNQFYNSLILDVSIGSYRSTINLGDALSRPCNNPMVSPPTQFFRYKICHMTDTGGDTIVVALESIAGVEYHLKVRGSIQVPLIQYPVTWSGGQEQNEVPRFFFTRKTISYMSIASVAPGARTEVSFTIPDVFWRNGPPQVPPNNMESSWIIDFSWLFDTRGATGSILDDFAHVYRRIGEGLNENSLSDEQRIMTIAGRIVYTGLATYSNPYDCQVYPLPVTPDQVHPQLPDDDDVKELIKKAYMETFGDGKYSRTTGIPFIIKDFPNGCSVSPQLGTMILDVKVKLPLKSGKYLIIPVFSYDDKDDSWGRTGRIQVNLGVEVRNPNGQPIAYKNAIEGEGLGADERGPTQFAFPMSVKAQSSGVYTVHFKVYWYAKDSLGSPTADMALYISKIIVIPMAGTSDVCLYQTPSSLYPAYPWEVIDTSTGSMYDYGKANIITVYKPSNPYLHLYPEAQAPIPESNNWYTLLTFNRYYSTTIENNAQYTSLSSWRYKNMLNQKVYIKSMVTDGDDRFWYAVGLLAVDVGYIRPPLDDSSPNTLYAMVSDIMRQGYFFVVAAGYHYYDSNPTQPDKKVKIQIVLSGIPYDSYGYYILVPYYFFGDGGQYTEPPEQIQVSGGTIISGGNPPSEPMSRGEILIVKAYSGTVTITFTLPTPIATDTPSTGINDVYTYLGIGGIAVILNPDKYVNQYDGGHNTYSKSQFPYGGIYLLNVEPISSSTPIYVKVYDEDGNLIREDSFTFGGIANIRIGIDELNGYLNYEYWTYPYKDMYVVISNAKCTMPGQGNSLGNYLGGSSTSSTSSYSTSSTPVSGTGTASTSGITTGRGESSQNSPQYITVTVRNTDGTYYTSRWIPIKITSTITKFWSGVGDGSDVYVTTGSGAPVRYMVAYLDKAHKYAVIYVYNNRNIPPNGEVTYKIWFGGTNKYPSYRVSPSWSVYSDNYISQAQAGTKYLYTRITSVQTTYDGIYVSGGTSKGYRNVKTYTLEYYPAKGLLVNLNELGGWTEIELDVTTVSGTTYKIVMYTFNSNGPEVYVYKNGVLVETKEVGQLSSLGLIAGYDIGGQVKVNLDSPIKTVKIVPLDGWNSNVKISISAYTPRPPEHSPQMLSITIS